MLSYIQTPFFWAGISLLGMLGANTAVNTRFGKKYRLFGQISGLFFSLGRIVMVLPFISQPRLPESDLFTYFGIGIGIISLIFIFPGFVSQPLIEPKNNFRFKTEGLFSFVRHPHYLGELLFSFAFAIFFRSTIGILFTPIWWVTLQFHIIHEEENLEKEFGPFYLEYKKKVKGRIIPLPPFEKPSILIYPFKNLVFRGGGMKGSAYTGALEVLDEKGLLKQIKRVAGSSAGAITATLVSFNLDFSDTLQLINSLDFKQVPQLKSDIKETDPEWLPKFLSKEVSKLSGDVEAFQRLMTKYGWYSSEYFNRWMRNVISERCDGNPNATFSDFKNFGFKDLYIISANVSKLEVSVFSAETSPNLAVADAVRMSMSIPLYFEVQRYNGINFGEGDFHVDGGILLNYPIHIFDQPKYQDNNVWYENGINWETLGFYLYTNTIKVSESNKIESFKDFIAHLYESYNVSLQIAEIENNQIDQRRTVKIDTLGISSTDFQLSKTDPKILALIEEGRKSTRNYLDNYHRFIIKK